MQNKEQSQRVGPAERVVPSPAARALSHGVEGGPWWPEMRERSIHLGRRLPTKTEIRLGILVFLRHERGVKDKSDRTF